jgi:hypothetical protein
MIDFDKGTHQKQTPKDFCNHVWEGPTVNVGKAWCVSCSKCGLPYVNSSERFIDQKFAPVVNTSGPFKSDVQKEKIIPKSLRPKRKKYKKPLQNPEEYFKANIDLMRSRANDSSQLAASFRSKLIDDENIDL